MNVRKFSTVINSEKFTLFKFNTKLKNIQKLNLTYDDITKNKKLFILHPYPCKY